MLLIHLKKIFDFNRGLLKEVSKPLVRLRFFKPLTSFGV